MILVNRLSLLLEVVIMKKVLAKNIIVIVLGLFVSGAVYAGCYCKKPPEPKKYTSLSVSSGCPCLTGAYKLNNELIKRSSVNTCVSRFDFSQLTGRSITLTSQDYGETFSCFYQNFITEELEEVVEYGTREEILSYHKACDRVIRDLAKYYKQPCVK